jgi:hypothetical protein
MLFTALILVSVDCEHDGLEQGVNLSHGDQAAEVRNVPWFGLEQEEKIPIFLCLFIIWKGTFL